MSLGINCISPHVGIKIQFIKQYEMVGEYLDNTSRQVIDGSKNDTGHKLIPTNAIIDSKDFGVFKHSFETSIAIACILP